MCEHCNDKGYISWDDSQQGGEITGGGWQVCWCQIPEEEENLEN